MPSESWGSEGALRLHAAHGASACGREAAIQPVTAAGSNMQLPDGSGDRHVRRSVARPLDFEKGLPSPGLTGKGALNTGSPSAAPRSR
jgi:hypothetical protein